MQATKKIGSGLGLLAIFAAGSALAVPNVPTTQPGLAGQRMQIEEPRPEVGGAPLIVLPEEKGLSKALKGEAKFTLKGITVEGSTVFTPQQLREEYAPYLNKDITLATLNQIASNITVRYRNAGYILSRAFVPPQKIKGGMVTIRVVEGYVSKVRFEGLKSSSSLLAAYANNITSARPLDSATLERYLLLIEDLPGVKATSLVRPSNVPGASDLIITVTNKPLDALVTVDNRGTRYMGPIQTSVTLGANNMLGLYDRTQLRGEITAERDEMWFAQVVHDEQLDSEGTKLELTAGHTRTHPGYLLKPFDINGRDDILSAEVSHPFIRSRQSNLYGNFQFDMRQTDTNAITGNLYDDKLRVFRLGGTYDFVDSWAGINRMEGKFSKGFNWDTGSGGLRSIATGQPDFFKFNAEASRLQPISGPFSLYLTAAGQASANTLLAAEQFGLGGDTYGSAYDPDEIVGDSGIGARGEIQYNGTGDTRWLPSYQVYGFYDGGKVWLRNAPAGLTDSESLVSTGFGVRFNTAQQIYGSAEFAMPVTRRVAAFGADGSAPRVFFSLAYRY